MLIHPASAPAFSHAETISAGRGFGTPGSGTGADVAVAGTARPATANTHARVSDMIGSSIREAAATPRQSTRFAMPTKGAGTPEALSDPFADAGDHGSGPRVLTLMISGILCT
jgi:hypothetical protein